MVRYAGFWRRSVAHLVDFVITNLASWGVSEALFAAAYGIGFVLARLRGVAIRPYGSAFDPLLEQIVSGVVYLGLTIPYYVWATYRYGKTPGKHLLRIRVVRDDDEQSPITLRQSVVRCLAYVPSYVAVGCGFLMAAFNSRKLALHDVLAGTASVVATQEGRQK